MGLLDELRNIRHADADRNFLELLGLPPGTRLVWDKDTLTIGDETVQLEDARRALTGDSSPGNRIRIEDL